VCAKWVSQSLTVEHKTEREAISSELLARFEAERKTYFSRIVAIEESWLYHHVSTNAT
jgi:hypothetical protein